MEITKDSIAGTLESSDVLVKISPSSTREIVINSAVFKQFGKQITRVVTETLDQLAVTTGSIIIEDKGALDCIIRARLQTAVLRASATQELIWEKLS